MIGFLLYSVTAAVVLFGYGFLQFIGPLASGRAPAASFASASAPGAALLFIAAVANLRKPRIAGFIALFGTLIMWAVLFSPMQISVFVYFLSLLVIGYVFPVITISILVGLSTAYAGIAVMGIERFRALPSWLFPKPLVPRAADNSKPEPPVGVRIAVVLLYCWLALLTGFILQDYWRGGHLGQGWTEVWALAVSISILDFTIVLAILWVILETSNGKNWARITLLVLFALGLRDAVKNFVQQSQPKLELAETVVEITIFGVAMILLWMSGSYFAKRHS